MQQPGELAQLRPVRAIGRLQRAAGPAEGRQVRLESVRAGLVAPAQRLAARYAYRAPKQSVQHTLGFVNLLISHNIIIQDTSSSNTAFVLGRYRYVFFSLLFN